MTLEQAKRVARSYLGERRMIILGCIPKPSKQRSEDLTEQHPLHYALSCCERLQSLDSTPKTMRWLGFVQGVLWACRVYTVEQLREHNRDA